MESPLLTVVMAAHNCASTLAEAVDSVLNQTYERFELYIVNDRSSDETGRIAKDYARKDKRVRYLENGPDQGGQSETRNRAIKEAKGEYVMIVDSDDICVPTRFAEQVAYMRKHLEVGVLGTDWTYFAKDDRSDAVAASCPDDGVRAAVPPVNNPTCCIRRAVFERYGYYDARFDNAEDTDLWFRWHAQGVRFANLHRVLYEKRTHAGNVSVVRLRSQVGLMLRILLRAFFKDGVRYSAAGYARMLETAAYWIYLSLGLNRLRGRRA